MPHHPALRASAALLTALALAAGVTACGDDGSSDPSSTSTAANGDVFNDADVAFATDMIPHHAQAIEMVTLTDGRDLDPAVQRLANQIRDAQAPEVETMSDWLTAWGEDVPDTSLDHANAGHDMDMSSGSMGDMPGMMSADEMQALEDAPDGRFQDLWLTMMKEHHEGAVEMATTEQEDGELADAVDLADSIITTQEAEIERIDRLSR